MTRKSGDLDSTRRSSAQREPGRWRGGRFARTFPRPRRRCRGPEPILPAVVRLDLAPPARGHLAARARRQRSARAVADPPGHARHSRAFQGGRAAVGRAAGSASEGSVASGERRRASRCRERRRRGRPVGAAVVRASSAPARGRRFVTTVGSPAGDGRPATPPVPVGRPADVRRHVARPGPRHAYGTSGTADHRRGEPWCGRLRWPWRGAGCGARSRPRRLRRAGRGRAWARPGPVVAKPRVAPHRRRAARSPRGQTDRRSRRSPGGTQTSAPQPAPKPAPAAPARPQPEPQPEPKPEAQPEAKPEPKPEAKPEPKPEPKPEAKDERPSRPQPLSRPQPSFSRAAREQLSGPVSVTVSITVSASGDVTSVSVTNSSGVGAIDSAAVSACHGWRFSAAKQGASFTQTFRIKPL